MNLIPQSDGLQTDRTDGCWCWKLLQLLQQGIVRLPRHEQLRRQWTSISSNPNPFPASFTASSSPSFSKSSGGSRRDAPSRAARGASRLLHSLLQSDVLQSGMGGERGAWAREAGMGGEPRVREARRPRVALEGGGEKRSGGAPGLRWKQGREDWERKSGGALACGESRGRRKQGRGDRDALPRMVGDAAARRAGRKQREH